MWAFEYNLRRISLYALLLMVLTMAWSETSANEGCTQCPGCPYHVDGQCITKPGQFGYYRTKWRRWPGDFALSDNTDRELRDNLPELELPEKLYEDESTTRPIRSSSSPTDSETSEKVDDPAPVLPDEQDWKTDPFQDDDASSDTPDIQDDDASSAIPDVQDDLLEELDAPQSNIVRETHQQLTNIFQSRKRRPHGVQLNSRPLSMKTTSGVVQASAVEPFEEKDDVATQQKDSNPLRRSTQQSSQSVSTERRSTERRSTERRGRGNPLRVR